MNALQHTPQLSLKVTPEIIARGIERNSNHCMIAEAVKEARPKLSRIAVDIQTIRATDAEKGERYVWITPRKVQLAIVDFDQGKKPAPFTAKLAFGQVIELQPKSEAQKIASRRYYHKKVKPARLKTRGGSGNTPIPTIRGGKAPPKSIGARRAFGLRNLQY